jgi:nucleoside-diphosphate-sugar epimerase
MTGEHRMPKSVLVTGGTGFIGSALVRRLITEGHQVRVLDDDSRGTVDRLKDCAGAYEYIRADIRDSEAVNRATKGVDTVCHLAAVNGTEFFYRKPDVVLDIGVKGTLSVLDACLKCEVPEFFFASSSEVYQTPPVIPTDENVPLSIPDPLNPRYSYAGAKIVGELLTLNYGLKHLQRAVVFRPHNVYGPAMGWEHVIPQFVLRMKTLCSRNTEVIEFPIQGTGRETRAFCYIDDFIDGLIILLDRAKHREIYNIGTREEMMIEDVAILVGEYFGRQVRIIPGPAAKGGTARRCPDIDRISRLGYNPQRTFSQGLKVTARWYAANAEKAPTHS